MRLAVVDAASLVWVAHAQGATGGLVYQPSLSTNTVPLYATASGKAYLATLGGEKSIRNVVRNGAFDDADRYGPNVLRSTRALLREVDATARRGYGLARNEAEPGVTALAAAIRPRDGGPALGTVSIAGPSVRMTDARVRELATLVVRSAADLSSLWPLRRRSGARDPAPSLAETASI